MRAPIGRKRLMVNSLIFLILANYAFGDTEKANYEQPHANQGGGKRRSYKYGNTNEVAVDEVEVPHPARVGQTVQLKCLWRVGSKGFYSLRWYKDDTQFYSYFKGDRPRLHILEGISVVLSESDDHVVTLKDISSKSEGVYMCEIMTDGPKFKISRGSANLTVVELPETPQLEGLHHSYMSGDTLNVTCRARNGRPAPTLAFKVNGVPIYEKSGRLTEVATVPGERPGVYTSATHLLLPLSSSYSPSFTLGCYASAHGLTVQKEVNVQVNQRGTLLTFFGSIGRGTILQSPGVIQQTIIEIIVIFIYRLTQ